MPWACRRFAVVFFVLGLLLVSGKVVAQSQGQSITSPTSLARSTVVRRRCGDRRPIRGPQRESGSPREADHSEILCAEVAFDYSATASPGHGDVREKANEDPVLEELKAMGEQGLGIERAREEVLEILESQNRCAAWFQQAEPHAARKFRSLRYTIDDSGPQYTFKIQNAAGEWLYQQPYVASSIEDASAGSTITVNGKGAFFQLSPRCCTNFLTSSVCFQQTAEVASDQNSPRKIRRSCCAIVARKWKQPGNTRACS